MLLLVLSLLIFAYLIYCFFMSHKRSCGRCGRCRTCRAEAFRFHRSDCGCNTCREQFRFRQAQTTDGLKAVNLSDNIPLGVANVSSINTAFPLYVNAYGDQLARGPKQGEPGAVAAQAQYTDLYKAAQKLEDKFGPFQTTYGYQNKGAVSDLHLAQEVNDQLVYELDVLK